MKPADKALIAELEQQARPILGRQRWPYGSDIDIAARQRLIIWASARKLKLAASRCQGLHWLRTGRCAVNVCSRLGRWMDHVTHWTAKAGPAVLVAQPYGLTNDDMIQLGELAGLPELEVAVPGSLWYGYNTVGVEVWRHDAFEIYMARGQ